ncbi:hypothetical protein NUW54_g14549 [Trametes sanguinea]|uniref:Uncharacterized protein n=1 Tax=Trametes sanguinea TaxID=158606 RepID=A0ACC1MCK8_9APHY|nr:hypothetical protein NUW54_g14549 [Trametes sanguinea]
MRHERVSGQLPFTTCRLNALLDFLEPPCRTNRRLSVAREEYTRRPTYRLALLKSRTASIRNSDGQGMSANGHSNATATYVMQKRHYKTLASILKDGVNKRHKLRLRDLEGALVALGFAVSSDKGSRYRFDPPERIGRVALRLHVHTNDLKYHHQDALKQAMESLYGWGPGTFVAREM